MPSNGRRKKDEPSSLQSANLFPSSLHADTFDDDDNDEDLRSIMVIETSCANSARNELSPPLSLLLLLLLLRGDDPRPCNASLGRFSLVSFFPSSSLFTSSTFTSLTSSSSSSDNCVNDSSGEDNDDGDDSDNGDDSDDGDDGDFNVDSLEDEAK